jgi:hypothetical protein
MQDGFEGPVAQFIDMPQFTCFVLLLGICNHLGVETTTTVHLCD